MGGDVAQEHGAVMTRRPELGRFGAYLSTRGNDPYLDRLRATIVLAAAAGQANAAIAAEPGALASV